MSDIVNLNRFRKKKQRADKEKRSEENRAKFGRAKSDRTLSDAERQKLDSHLDGHKKE